MNYNGTASTTPHGKITLADFEATVEKLRGIPPAKWLLVAPDGKVWAEENPMQLAKVCFQHASAQQRWAS
jgi:hypothetical protein